MFEIPDTLSLDGLRYKEQDYRLLIELSALDIKKFLARNEASTEKIMDTMKLMAYSLLHNPRLPDPMVVNERINQLTRSLNDVVLESNAYQKRIDKLEVELHHERENNVLIRNSARPSPALLVPQTLSVPDPERFGGSWEKLLMFCSHLLMKLRGDSHKFPSNQHQWRYTIGLLTDQAFTQIVPYIKEDRIELASVTELLKVLEIAFGDPDCESTAERKLKVLREANREFSLYYDALVDCAATGYAFIDEDFASCQNFPLFKLTAPRNLRVIDGCPIASGAITHIAKLKLQIR